MNTFQQSNQLKEFSEEKDEIITQADTNLSEDNPSIFDKISQLSSSFLNGFFKNCKITNKVTKDTFASDKILKLIASLLKITRNFNVTSNLKSVEMINAQIGQLRRLLRYDRIFMIIKEYRLLLKKSHLSQQEKVMVFFKFIILYGDINDILAYFHQTGFLKHFTLGKLKSNVADIYFFQCLGWLIYHIRQYNRNKDEQTKNKNLILIIRYLIDTFTSHNDFSHRMFTINPKIVVILGFLSSMLNLWLAWK